MQFDFVIDERHNSIIYVAPSLPVDEKCAGCGRREGATLWPDMRMGWCEACGGSPRGGICTLLGIEEPIPYWQDQEHGRVFEEWVIVATVDTHLIYNRVGRVSLRELREVMNTPHDKDVL